MSAIQQGKQPLTLKLLRIIHVAESINLSATLA
jgi:hypothetical protein